LVEKKRSKWPEIFWQESLNHIWPSSFMEKKVLKILCQTSYMFKTGQKSYFIDLKTGLRDQVLKTLNVSANSQFQIASSLGITPQRRLSRVAFLWN
jgi:hypothetical protein